MSSQKNFLVILTTSLLVTITAKSSFAFSITPDQTQSIKDSDGTYQYEQFYESRQGVTRLDAWPDLNPGKPFPPDPRRDFNKMGDGLLYWLLIAIFTLSNNLLLRLHPELL
ncbi:hypothetical protein [Nostoc sp.]|uniref:hypothetical protein n=1 Tax=Nostoc sp. TaxID=1180 RepID=UPI002FF711D2